MYVTAISYPYITYAASILSHFNTNYSKQHWTAIKIVVRYLKGTLNQYQKFKVEEESSVDFVDLDWEDDEWVILKLNASISWKTKQQCTEAKLSTEYTALSEVI
jgi:hypothetical protein